MYGTPTMFVDMVKLQQEARFDLSSLHTGIMAGAPCPRDLCEQTIRHLNMKDFVVSEPSTVERTLLLPNCLFLFADRLWSDRDESGLLHVLPGRQRRAHDHHHRVRSCSRLWQDQDVRTVLVVLLLCLPALSFPLDHVEVKVVDPEGKVVPPGERGELCSRGYSTMLGYWGDEEKTREAVTPDRWFHTG